MSHDSLKGHEKEGIQTVKIRKVGQSKFQIKLARTSLIIQIAFIGKNLRLLLGLVRGRRGLWLFRFLFDVRNFDDFLCGSDPSRSPNVWLFHFVSIG